MQEPGPPEGREVDPKLHQRPPGPGQHSTPGRQGGTGPRPPSPDTHLLAALARLASTHGERVVDVLGARGQQVARDVILVLLGRASNMALPTRVGHYHLRAGAATRHLQP